MAGLLDLFGGGGGSDPMDIYGDLFDAKQKAALRDQQMTQGLLNAAAIFSKAGQASRLPQSIPWGEAAQALGGGGDEAMNRMLKGMQVAEEVRSSRQKRGFADQVAKFAQGLLEQEKTLGLPQGTLVKPYLAATGGATGGPTASNAPPPPPTFPSGDIGGPVSGGFPGDFPGDGAAPDKAAGLLDPGGYGGGGLPGQGVLASLGGGPALPPFGPGSQGSPDLSNIRIEQLGSEALPVDAPFPTLADPNKPRSAWAQGTRYDRGDTPFDPARPFATPQQFAAPPSELDRLSQLMKVQTAAPGDSRLAALTRQYESGDRNIMQQINDTGTAGGYYQITDPTWRDIAPKAGIDLDKYPTAISAPREVQDAAAKALRETRGMQPWSSNKPLMAAIGGRDNIRIEPLGGEAAPAGAAPAGKIPGLNISPQGLAALNMLSKLGGLGEPFGSLLETYYKSPGYLGEAARTEAEARKQIEQKYDPIIEAQKTAERLKVETQLKPQLEAEIAWAKVAPNLDEHERKAIIDRKTEQLRALGVAATSSKEVVVEAPGRPPEKRTLTNEQILRLNSGNPLPEIGLPVGTRLSEPSLSPEQQAAQTQRGKTGEEMREVQVWTPTGLVTQQMRNVEIETRRKLTAERGPGGAPQIGDIVDKPAMNQADQKIADALGEDFITLRRQAIAADKTIRDTHNLRSKIDSGMFTGLDANINLFLARLGDTMGWKNLSDADKVKNTQTYIAGLGSEVLSMVKDLKPASNVDLQFASQMAGGQNLSAASIRQLLDMREEYARLAIQRHNEEAAGRNPAIFQGARRELPMPPAYQPKELVTPSGNKAIINR